MKLGRLSFIVLVLLIGSCATGPKITVEDSEWGARIGTYTYQDV